MDRIAIISKPPKGVIGVIALAVPPDVTVYYDPLSGYMSIGPTTQEESLNWDFEQEVQDPAHPGARGKIRLYVEDK